MSAFYVAYGKKRPNGMPLNSFDSRVSHQTREEILFFRATPISINNLATKFPLRLDG